MTTQQDEVTRILAALGRIADGEGFAEIRETAAKGGTEPGSPARTAALKEAGQLVWARQSAVSTQSIYAAQLIRTLPDPGDLELEQRINAASWAAQSAVLALADELGMRIVLEGEPTP